MNSKIYTGKIMHRRLEKCEHAFVYPHYFFAIDLEELRILDGRVKGFGYNRFSLFSICDEDYGRRGREGIRVKLDELLDKHQLKDRVSRVELVTSPRILGHVFNPVSFYYCYSASEALICVVAEVNNTFGERHVYLLDCPLELDTQVLGHYRVDKAFHVSPFFDMSGSYEFRFSALEDKVEIDVDLMKAGKPALEAKLVGRANEMSSGTVWKTFFKFPLTILMVVPRIHWQAAKLYFLKKVKFYKKPSPESEMTIRKKAPSGFQKRVMKKMFEIFSKAQKGKLEIALPEGEVRVFGDESLASEAVIQVRDYRFFSRFAFDGAMGGIALGEGYMAGDWKTDDLTAGIRFLILNLPFFERKKTGVDLVFEKFLAWKHSRKHNNIEGSQRNISSHYDLSNEFFSKFLDETMTYSCGYFEESGDTLKQSQLNKIHRMIQKARIGKDDHVLEIGCGWGAFAIEAVKTTGCRVTGLTLSKEQLKFALDRVKAEGLEDRIELKLCDYRHEEGQYDRIVSIEMLEAVGHQYFGDYFGAFERLLKPEGIAAVQVITIPDERYEGYLERCDFIQKHIFPGGHLPSLAAMTKSLTEHTKFFVDSLENIGPHYAPTLALWHQAMKEKKSEILELGFSEEMLRAWEFYFSYCEGAFITRHLNVLQFVLTRSGNTTWDEKGVS